MADQSHKEPLILYDGVCALCNGFIRWVIKHDRNQIFYFSSLQSSYSQELLSRYQVSTTLDSIIVINDGQVFSRSDAVIQVLQSISGFWRLIGRVLKIVPKVLRDAGYRIIAALRYKTFGRYEVCPLLPEDVRKRVLG